MDVFLRNITTDEDVEVSLSMDSGKLKELTGKDEWIIADSPVGEELTSILMLNELVKRFGEENLIVLAEAFLLSEIEEKEPDDFVIIDFDSETACYNAVSYTHLSYDFYVANEDTGYGYRLESNIPYDYADGTDLTDLALSYDEFVKKSEELLTSFIKENDKVKGYSLIEKANKPLLIW